MNYGYVKVGAITKQIKIGDVDFNKNQIISGMELAEKERVNLLVFPELSITGYTAGDLFYYDNLLNASLFALNDIAKASDGKNVITVVGLPFKYDGLIYNVAGVVGNGKILGIVPKTFLPNYNESCEKRWYAPALDYNVKLNLFGEEVVFGKKLLFKADNLDLFIFSCEICEDLWTLEPPSIKHAINGATIIANLSCEAETIGKAEYRKSLVSMHSAKIVAGYVYANAGDGESTTDLVFGGHNIISENGKILTESSLFENELIVSEIDTDYILHERRKLFNYNYQKDTEYETVLFKTVKNDLNLTRSYPKTPFVPTGKEELNDRSLLILNLQANALKTRIAHTNAKTAVIGLSGGLDSTLALLVAHRAMTLLGRSPKEIIGVTMPCFGTTSRTLNNTIALAKALGITFKKIDISKTVTKHLKDIKHDLKTLDVTFENAQARERTQVIMDIANMTGGLVVGTGDLSEMALGWATYNGDHMSMYSVNSSVPKTLVRHLVNYVTITSKPKLRSILLDILDTPVSPELLPAENGEISQKTEEIVGPYILHDFYLYMFVRMGFSPKKIYYLAKRTFKGDFSDETILKWLKIFIRRFFNQQFKRSCVPDGVKIGSVALSPRGDWRMPSDACSKLWLDELENL